MYVCVYVCVCVCVCVCFSVDVSLTLCFFSYVHVCVYVCVYVYTCVFLFLSVNRHEKGDTTTSAWRLSPLQYYSEKVTSLPPSLSLSLSLSLSPCSLYALNVLHTYTHSLTHIHMIYTVKAVLPPSFLAPECVRPPLFPFLDSAHICTRTLTHSHMHTCTHTYTQFPLHPCLTYQRGER